MKLSTEIPIEPMKHRVVYGDGMLFLGSCFADEIGSICKGMGFNALVNPFGTLYNPVSISNAVNRLTHGTCFSMEDVIQVGKQYYCTFEHNTEFWNTTKEGLLKNINIVFNNSLDHFARTQWVIVSLGTAWVFRHHETHKVVSNCHKMPSRCFERDCLSVSSAANTMSEMVHAHPDKDFIFTVSPLRHLKDGLHGNQLSKATLLLSVNQVCMEHPNAYYFPAYEILLDELRDYRFYKEDMVHPTDQAVHYIWERFVDFAIADSERPAMQQASELRKMYRHQALFPESQAYQRFLATRKEKEEQLKNRYPAVISAHLPH